MGLRRTFISAFLFLAMSLGIQSNLSAQVGFTGMPFLLINTQARSMGMAGANMAMPYNQAGAHLNPAVIGTPGRLEISTQFNDISPNSSFHIGINWFPDFDDDMYFYMPSIQYSTNKWSFAYQYAHIDLGEQEARTPDGSLIGRFSSYEYAHTLTAAYHWNKYISTGLGVNFVKSDRGNFSGGELDIRSAYTHSLDFGLYGAYPYTFGGQLKVTPSLGWSLSDFAYPVSYGAVTEEAMPIMMRGGFGFRLEYLNSFSALPLIGDKKPLSVGLYRSYSKIMARFQEGSFPSDQPGPPPKPMGPFKALFNSWDTFKRYDGRGVVTVSPAEQLMHHSGLEITLFDIISYRWGYFREDDNNGARKFHTEGFGLNYKYLSLDYVEYNLDYEDHPLANTSYYQFTLSLPIN